MRRLGAILAGGAARRFGSDKALALLGGTPLIDHVVDRLAGQCDAVVVVGRDHRGLVSLADRPGPGFGPLAGLNAALHHAAALGFAEVLSTGCDLPGLPDDTADRLAAARQGGRAVFAAGQPLVGLWPVALAPALDAHLAAGGSRSLFAFAAAVDAVAVDLGPIANVNTPADLARLTDLQPFATRATRRLP